jgi:phage gp36-like protein
MMASSAAKPSLKQLLNFDMAEAVFGRLIETVTSHAEELDTLRQELAAKASIRDVSRQGRYRCSSGNIAPAVLIRYCCFVVTTHHRLCERLEEQVQQLDKRLQTTEASVRMPQTEGDPMYL